MPKDPPPHLHRCHPRHGDSGQPYWLNAVAILGAYFLFSAVIEERTTARLRPAAYPPHKHAPKMLIPYIL